MTAKEYLKQLSKLECRINHKRNELSELRSRAYMLNGIDYSKEPIKSSVAYCGAHERVIDAMYQIECEILCQIRDYESKKHKIIDQIHEIDNPLYESILYKRYVEFKSLELIAVELNYSYEWIRHAHGLALEEFRRMFLPPQ